MDGVVASVERGTYWGCHVEQQKGEHINQYSYLQNISKSKNNFFSSFYMFKIIYALWYYVIKVEADVHNVHCGSKMSLMLQELLSNCALAWTQAWIVASTF